MRHAVWLWAVGLAAIPAAAALPDKPFAQEYRVEVAYPEAAGAVRAICAAADGSLWLAAKTGVYHYANERWKQIRTGSTYSLAVFGTQVFAGAWDGLYRVREDSSVERVASVRGPIVALTADATGVIAAGQDALYLSGTGEAWQEVAWHGSRAIRSIARDRLGGIWVATSMGAYYRDASSVMTEYHDEQQLVSGEVKGVVIAPDGSVWFGSTGGLDRYRSGKRVEWFNSSKGMPAQEVECVAVEEDGTLWVGTPLGAVRRMDNGWSLRHSRRWLPSDSVISIATGGPDHTVWVATANGLSAIHRRLMTLEEKAQHYLQICYARHVRPPGLVEQCDLAAPGDTAHFVPRDDDNDGQYTGMYLAMESFRYAATHDPEARARARQAFHALLFLQEVTGTRGFVARTVTPIEWTQYHDANERLSAEDKVDRMVESPRSKPIENRWRVSADGRWRWKGDTSSDEITGHFFGYLQYYDLAADESEKELVRAHARRVMDHILEGGYTLKDIDGRPTLWGVWSPEKLNGDPDWRAERWTNGLEILAYLNTTYHVTGDEKYRRRSVELIEKEHYDVLARRPLAVTPSERTQFDHELLAMALLDAMKTETDSRYRRIYEDALAFWLPLIRDQNSSFYSFVYAALAGGGIDLNGCLGFLRDEPLELVQWTVDNRAREDVRFAHEPNLDEVQIDRILPPSERAPMRWDGNPWRAVQGEEGKSESSGVHWLLPYWMGRYYGLIARP